MEWLQRCIKKVGKTEAELAKVLWKERWTAVAEVRLDTGISCWMYAHHRAQLCDDSFEEHVLPITPENTGLHLHGLNRCSKHFATEEPDVVDAFARDWGFIVTKSTVLKTIPEVRAFTEEVGRSGVWEGAPLEGFVVRTRVAEPPTTGNTRSEMSPYEPGSSFFFKVKFDEPYMMYRDWREVTKMLLNQKGGLHVGALPKKKMQRAETRVYARWVAEEIKRDRSQFEGYGDNHGIIATRERFLKWLAGKDGKKQIDEERTENAENAKNAVAGQTAFGKTIIVPVAVPGCGPSVLAFRLWVCANGRGVR
jgi:tRNA ligase